MEGGAARKFKIREGDKLLLLNAPGDFLQRMAPLPSRVKLSDESGNPQQVHWFIKTKSEVQAQMPKIKTLVKDGVLLWIYFPKKSSKMQTDLTRDEGWEPLHALGLKWLSLVSFDETWSAFAMKKAGSEKPKKSLLPDPLLSEYIDTANRIVKIPADLSAAFSENVKLKSLFEKLPFTHKKEYVIWILSAKKEETRKARIKGTIEKLSAYKK